MLSEQVDQFLSHFSDCRINISEDEILIELKKGSRVVRSCVTFQCIQDGTSGKQRRSEMDDLMQNVIDAEKP